MTLTAVPRRYIDHVQVTPDIHTGAGPDRVELAGAPVPRRPAHIRIAASDDAGATVGGRSDRLVGRARRAMLDVTWNSRVCGTSTIPTYTPLTISLGPRRADDELSTALRLPRNPHADGQLLLNGEPIFPALRARPGPLPRHHLHRALGGVPARRVPEGERAGPQQPALPYQAARPALSGPGRRDGPARLGRDPLLAHLLSQGHDSYPTC